MAAFQPIGVVATVKGLNVFTTKMGKMRLSIGGVAKGITNFVTVSAIAMTAALAAIGKASLDAAIEWESSFAGIRKTVETSEQEFDELASSLRELSTIIPVDVNQLNRIAELGGQLGVVNKDTEDVSKTMTDFTRIIADLSVSTDLTAEQGAKQLARFANIMQTTAEFGEESFSRLGSAIVDLGNKLETSEPEILNFGLRIAGAGKIAGLTEADIFGIGAAMSSVGVQAEAGGTAVQKVLLAMNEAVLGTSESFIDNTGAIDKVQKKYETLQERLQVAILRQSEFTDRTKESTKLAAQIKIDNLTDQLAEQDVTMGNLIATHGQLSTAQNKLSVFANVAGLEAAKFQELWEEDAGKAFQLFVAGLGKAGDDALPVLEALELKDQRLIRSFLSLANAGDKLEESMGFANTAFAANTALAAEAAKRYATTESQLAIMKNTLKDISIEVGLALLPVLNDLLVAAKPFIKQFGTWIADVLPKAIDKVVDLFNQFTGTFERYGNILFAVSEVLDDFFSDEQMEGVFAFNDFIMDSLIPILQDIWNWLAVNIPVAIQTVSTFFTTTLLPIIQDVGNWIQTVLIPTFIQVWQWLQQNIPVAIQTVTDFWTNTLLPGIMSVWDFIQNSVIPAFNDIVTWLQTNIPLAITTAETFLRENFLGAMNLVTQIIVAAQSIMSAFFEGGLPAAIQVASGWFDFFGTKIQMWWTANVLPTLTEFQTWWNTNWPIIQAVAMTVWEVIKGVILAVVDVIQKQVVPQFQEAFASIEEAMAALGIDWVDIWNTIKVIVAVVAIAIGTILIAMVAVITGIVNAVTRVIRNVTGGLIILVEGFKTLIEGIALVVGGIMATFQGLFTGNAELLEAGTKALGEGLETIWEGIMTNISGFIEIGLGIILGLVSGFVEGVIGFFVNLSDNLVGNSIVPDMIKAIVKAFTDVDWLQLGIDIVEGIAEGVKNTASKLVEGVKGVVSDAIAAAKKLLGIESPSKVFELIGAETMAGFAQGIVDLIPEVQATMAMAVSPQAAQSVSAGQVVSSNNVNIQFNNTINDQIDMQIFKNDVLNIVTEAINI